MALLTIFIYIPGQGEYSQLLRYVGVFPLQGINYFMYAELTLI